MPRLARRLDLRVMRPRAERVLLAVDFNAPSLAAARWVARHLAPEAEVVLAHVLPLPRPPSFLRGRVRTPDRFIHHVSAPIRGALEGLATTLGSPRVRLELRAGEPAEQLAELADLHGVDLVCVGRACKHGQTVRLGRNTVDRLLRRLTVPLLQASGSLDTAPSRVLAAVDGRGVSGPVLRYASRLAARLEARLTALHVLDDELRAYVRAMEATAGNAADARTAEEALCHTAAGWLTCELERAGAHQERAHPMVAYGDPGQEVLRACRQSEADLLVVGRTSHEESPAGAIGGTTRLALRAATCPVLVVPEGLRPSTPPDDGVRKQRQPHVVPATTRVSEADLADGSDDAADQRGRDAPPAASAATSRPA